MKIVLVGPAFPLRGGIADFNEALGKAFNTSGIETVLYSYYYQYPGFLFPGKTQYSEGMAPEGLQIKTTISSVNPLSWFATARRIISEKPDFVIVRYWLPFMGPSLGTICRRLRKKGIRVIAITDNVIPHEHRTGDRLLTGYFVKSCDGFVAMSKSVLDDLSSFTDSTKKIFLPHPIYNIFGEGVSKQTARKDLGIPEAEKWILFFGFIRPYKGLDLLLQALADKRLADRNVHLLVAGEFYEEEKKYHALIQQLGLADRIILHTSFIPKEKVKSYFCAADLVVQPYRSATQSGITQIAYHFGRPMLVTDVGGLGEIVPNGRVGYVTEVSPVSIADAITDFYEKSREQEFSAHVQVEKERFSWSSFTKGVLQLYDQLR